MTTFRKVPAKPSGNTDLDYRRLAEAINALSGGEDVFNLGTGITYDGTTVVVEGTTIDSVPIGTVDIASRGWSVTNAFSATDADTVSWGSGDFISADGTTYSIGAGNTGNMTARTYIYLDTAVSEIAYQTSTTATDAVGSGKVLIGVAEDATDEAFYHIFGGIGGVLVTANEIATNAVTANEINVSTLSAISANVGTLTSGTITGISVTATTGAIGGWTLSANDLSSGNFKINSTNEEMEIGSATAPLTGTGIWLGKDGADYEFRVGNPSGAYIHWDGSNLTVTYADGYVIDDLRVSYVGDSNTNPTIGFNDVGGLITSFPSPYETAWTIDPIKILGSVRFEIGLRETNSAGSTSYYRVYKNGTTVVDGPTLFNTSVEANFFTGEISVTPDDTLEIQVTASAGSIQFYDCFMRARIDAGTITEA